MKQLTVDGTDSVDVCYSAIRYMGGKSYLAPYIIRLMPTHKVFLEVFGGAGHVIFQKPPVDVNVYNDIDNNLSNFFLCLRDSYDELMRRLQVPYSRYIHDKWSEEWKQSPPSDDIERASRWYYLNRTSFNGQIDTGFSISRVCNVSLKNPMNLHKALDMMKRKLSLITVENKDFEDVIKLYDAPDTLIYADPPYIDVKRVDDYYEHSFTVDDHKRLSEILNNIQGKAIVSYYPSDKVKELYSGWNILEIDVYKRAQYREGIEQRDMTVEWLLYNFGGSSKGVKKILTLDNWDSSLV